MTLGEVKDILAGLRCSIIQGVSLPDETPVEVTAAEIAEEDGGPGYMLAVEWEGGAG